MGRKTKYTKLAALLLTFSTLLYAQDGDRDDINGMISYIEGTVDVYRDGEQLPWHEVDIGFELQEYDLVKTADDGAVDIDLELPSGRTVAVHISPKTAFYFSLGVLESGSQTRFDLLKGTIGFKVKRLAFAGEVAVRTQTVAMGVRGTEFTVTTAPEGSLLVTCSEGEVVCFDDEGASRLAESGTAVEKTDDGLRGITVSPSDLEDFRTNWFEEREAIFRAGAPVFITGFALQYLQYVDDYEEAYTLLWRERDIFAEWARTRARDGDISLGEHLLQRRDVTPAVIAMRAIFPVFEQVFYRLQVLESYHSQGIGQTTIRRNLSSDQFFRSFNRRQMPIEREFAYVRYCFKLFAWGDGFSDSDIMEETFSDSNPIEGEGPPKPTDPRSLD